MKICPAFVLKTAFFALATSKPLFLCPTDTVRWGFGEGLVQEGDYLQAGHGGK
jgi:hypothetical protein